MRRHHSLHLDDLRTVLAVAEERNFHRAGVRVGLTQSGVTRAIARVERQVGTLIFERSHNRYESVSTTDAGCHYIERIKSAVAQTEIAEASAREARNGIVHCIVVGRSIYTDRRILGILRTMDLPLYSNLVVDFKTKLPAELPICVRTGELDLAVVSNSAENPYLVPKVLRSAPFMVVLPREHRCANKQSVTLKDLASMPWVLFERHIHPLLYDGFIDRAHQLGITVKRIYHIAQAEEACEVARTVGGAAFLSAQGAEHLAKDEMIARPLEEKSIFLKTQVLIRRDNPTKLASEFVRAFMKRLDHAGLYQPELPLLSSNGRHVEPAQPSLFTTTTASV